MRKIKWVVCMVIIIIVVPLVSIKTKSSKTETIKNLAIKSSSDLPKGIIKEYEIKSGDTFVKTLNEQGVPYEEATSILGYSKEVFDFTKINAGKMLKLIFINEAFAAMEYPLNSDEVIHVKKEGGEFKVTKEDIPYLKETVVARGIITDSLFLAGQKAELEDKTILELTDIFSSEIDFTTDIQENDSFSIVYEKRRLEGKDSGDGKILAAKFTNNGIVYTAFRYNNKFYDEEGKSLTRQFLKSPLSYARISSGFTYNRKHPITKQVKPHRAIDYAAPNGTPVIATGSGKVSTAGSKGGLGITVEIKHGEYLTQYAHLSKIANGIKSGTDVVQGGVIGYVGSTGTSTGPHLQYAMLKDGNPINPQTTDFPKGKSIQDSEMADFNTIKSQFIFL